MRYLSACSGIKVVSVAWGPLGWQPAMFAEIYTLAEYRGKTESDGPRYKSLDNSIAVPVMRWIGQRIAAVDLILRNSPPSIEERA